MTAADDSGRGICRVDSGRAAGQGMALVVLCSFGLLELFGGRFVVLVVCLEVCQVKGIEALRRREPFGALGAECICCRALQYVEAVCSKFLRSRWLGQIVWNGGDPGIG